MKKKGKGSFIIILIGVLLLSGFYLDKTNSNEREVSTKKTLVSQQAEIQFSTQGYTINHPKVIVNPYGNSPLTALILFETKEQECPKITVKGKDQQTTFTHVFKQGKKHMLPVYGLYPNQKNSVEITLQGKKKITKEVTIQTEALPDIVQLPTSVYANKEKLGNELYFYTPSSVGYTCAYDINGDVRWYLKEKALWKIDRLKNGHLLVSSERLMNPPYYMSGLYEMDLLGKVYVEYRLPGGYHHDYFEMDSGNLLVASNDFNNEKGTVEDYLVELDRNTGEIVKTFDLKDVLKMDDGQSENWTNFDWFHNNAVWYDQKTNSITLSGRHQDAVINIDYHSGTLNWIIGDPTNWSEAYQKYFFTPVGDGFEWQWSQHAAMITPEGYVFILDNGNNKSKNKEEYVSASNSYSRGVMYKINTRAMTIEQVWQYGKERGSEFYSPYISDVDYLQKGHYIVHSGGIVYVDGMNSNYPAGFSKNAKMISDTVELLDDEVIFELKLPTNYYRVEKMSLYNKEENFVFEQVKQLGTLGESEVEDKQISLLVRGKKIDETYQNHKITLEKEIDRLVVKGTFLKENEVNIILYQNFVCAYYPMKISKRPYTALCVDVFNEEESENGLEVTKYINEDGLKGEYSIYIEIDGNVYDTNQYVIF